MEQVGRYRITQELGKGPRGSVYKAQDQQTGRIIAIKTIRLTDIEDQGQRERLRAALLKGVQSAEALSHPNIATLYGVVEQDGVACLLTEYSAANSLRTSLETGSVPDANVLLHFLRQVAEGLDYAHRKGIIHGNLKAENILVSQGGQALERHAELTDYGMAKFVIEDVGLPGRDPQLASYLSPEQIRDGIFNGSSDQFSLAALAYEILTGKKPFRAGNLAELADAICLQNLTPVQDFDGTLSDTVDRVLQKGMAKNPSRRFPTCSAFVGTLTIALGDCPNWSSFAKKTPGSVRTILREAKPNAAAREVQHDEAPQALAATQAAGVAASVFSPAEPIAPEAPKADMPILFDEPTEPLPAESPKLDTPAFDYTSVYGRMDSDSDKKGLSRIQKIGIGVAALAVVGISTIYLTGWRPEPDMPTQVLDPSAGPVSPPPKEDRIASNPRAKAAVAQPASADSPLQRPAATRTAPPSNTVPEPPPQVKLPSRAAQPPAMPLPTTPLPATEAARPVRSPSGTASFDLLSEPPGAKIVVDSDAASACNTPCTMTLATGRHTAEVEMSGYGLARRIFNIPESNSLFVTLARNMGAILLTSTPGGSDVSVDGAPRGKTPVTLHLTAGPHRISMTYNGMKHEETINIENDAMTARSFQW